MVNIRDNVSAGLKSIQKEQLRIKKELQETKEVLKETFGRKWSIKLQPIELLRYLRELGSEISLLRKQLVRIPKGSEGEISSPDMSFAENNIIRVWPHNGQENTGTEEAPKFKWQPTATFSKMGEPELSSKDEFAVSFVDKSITGVASIAFVELAKTASVALTGAAALSFAPLAPVVGLAASELTKGYLKHQNKLENLGSIMEEQGLHIENVFRGINPNMDSQAAKDKSVNYMKLIRDNSADTGFDQNDVLIAGTMAVELTDGNINGAMDYIRLAEDMKAVNPGSSVTETMQAIYEAKKGNMEALQRFLPSINLQNIKPEEFEGKVMKQLMDQYKGGTEEWLKTSAGLEARNEMIEIRDSQDKAIKVNEAKKHEEEREYRRRTNTLLIRPGNKNNKPIHERSKAGRESRVKPIEQRDMAIAQEKRMLMSIRGIKRTDKQLIDEMMIHKLTAPNTEKSLAKNEEGLIKENNKTNNQIRTYELPQAYSQNSMNNIQNQTFNININAVKMTIDEIVNEVVPRLKLALSNATAASA